MLMKKVKLFITLICAVIIGMVALLIIAVSGGGSDKRETVAYADATDFTNEIYWALDDSTVTLLISDSQIEGYECGMFEGTRNFGESLSGTWHERYGNGVAGFKAVSFLKPIAPEYINSWFSGFHSLTEINNIINLDTSGTVGASYAFYNCLSLTSLDLSKFEALDAENITGMLFGLDSLTSITISQKISDYFVDGTLDSFGSPNEDAFWLSPTKQKIKSYREMSEAGTYVNPYSPKIYWSYNGGTLTFSPTGTGDSFISGLSGETPWVEKYKNNVTAVEFTGTVKPAYTSRWFSEFRLLTAVKGLNFLDTSYTTHMEEMFCGCASLVELDTVYLKTGSALYLSNMFDGCVKLAALNVSAFDTSNVLDMGHMFRSCRSVQSLDLSSFEVSYCENFDGMLYDMPAITELTVSSSVSAKLISSEIIFDNPTEASFWLSPTGKRIDRYSEMSETGTYTCPYTPLIYWAYGTADNVSRLTVSSNVISGKSFSGASAEVPWSNYSGNIKSVVVEGTVSPASTASWFAECTQLTAVDLSGLDTSYTTDMSEMFYGCSALKSLDLSRFEVSDCASFTEMFTGTDSLEEITVSPSLSDCFINGAVDSFTHPDGDAVWLSPSGRRISACGDMNEQGKYVSSYTPIIYWDYSNRTLRLSDRAISKNIMYGNVAYGRELPWSESVANIEKVIVDGNVRPVYADCWFEACVRLSTVDLSGLNTSYTVSMRAMFSGCTSLETLDLSNILTANVRNTEYLFNGCTSLTALDLGTFDMSACSAYTDMLASLKSLREITVSKSVAENMSGLNFDVLGATTPWYYCDDGPSELIYDARQMSRAGRYVNPVSAAIYWQYNSFVLTVSDTPFTGNYCGKIAVTEQFGENGLPWYTYNASIRSVIVRGNVAPVYTSWWFSSLQNVTTIDLTELDTAYTHDMTGMFYNCRKLADLKLGDTFNVSSVVSMDEMFGNCIALRALDLSSFDTPRLTSMNRMFYVDADNGSVSQLAEINLSNINVSRCDGFGDSFYGLSSIRRVNVSLSLAAKLAAEAAVFDYPNESAYWLSPSGKKITRFTQMKEEGEYVCPYSSRIYWKNDNGRLTVSDSSFTSGQFYSFNPLNAADETNVYWRDRINVTAVTSVIFVGNVAPATARNWFNGFTSLTAIDLSCLDTSYTTDMAYMFAGCSKLGTLDMSGLNVGGCNDFENIFFNIPALKVIILSETLANKFSDTTIVFENVNESSPWYTHEGVKITSSAQMNFGAMYINPYTPVIYWQYNYGTLTLSSQPLGGINSGSFPMTLRMDGAGQDPWADYRDAVNGNSPITTVTVQSEIKPSNTCFWFCGFSKLTTFNGLDKLAMSYVTDMSYMFAECHALKTLDLRMLSTSNVTDMSYAFYNCNALASLDLSSFEMTNCKLAAGMLSGLSALTEISISASLADKMAYVDFTPINSAAWYYEDGTKISEASKMKKAGLYISSYTPVIYWNYTANSGALVISAKEQTHARNDGYGSFLAGDVFQTYDWVWNHNGNGRWAWVDSESRTPWEEYKSGINTVSFVGNVAPVNMAGWFRGCASLTSVDLSGLDASNVTHFRLMFYGCASLNSLDMSNLDVSSAMYCTGSDSGTGAYNGLDGAFGGLSSLGSITLSETLAAKFNGGYAYVENVTCETPWHYEDGTTVTDSAKMRWAGRYGSSYSPVLYWSATSGNGTLTVSDKAISNNVFSGADIFAENTVPWGNGYTKVVFSGNVKPLHMSFWFCNFVGLKSIDLSGLDTLYTQDMESLFDGCTALQTVTFGDAFSTGNVENMYAMFRNCHALKNLDLRLFNTENVNTMGYMFYCCCSLESLDLSNFTVTKVQDFAHMLEFGDAKLKNINISLGIATNITATHFDQAGDATPWRGDGGALITDVSQMTAAGRYYYGAVVVFKNGETLLATVEIEKDKPVVYAGATPTKNDAADTAYIDFLGWTETDGGSGFVDLSTVTQSATLYASFSSIRLLAPENGIIYDGIPHVATFENKTGVPDGGYVIDYLYSETADGAFVAESSPERAGWHKARIVFGSHSISVTYKISKKEVKITGGVIAEDKAYDATAKAVVDFTNAVIIGLAEGDDVRVASVVAEFTDTNANNNVTVSFTDWVLGGADAGNYVVAASGNVSAVANITKKDVLVQISVEDSVVGHVKAASAQVLGCEGIVAPVVTLTYTDGKGYNSTKLPDAPARYTVIATIANANFNLVGNDRAQFEIVSPYNTITDVLFEKEEYFYGDLVKKPQVTATHGTGTEQVTYFKDINRTQPANISETVPPDAGTYYVYVRIPASSDYGEAATTVVLVVKPKTVTVNITAGGGVYGGDITYPTVTVVGDTEKLPSVSLSYFDVEGNKLAAKPVNAGTYTAEADLSDKNYKIEGTRSTTFTIEGISVSGATVSAVDSQVYTGFEITPSVKVVLGSRTLISDTDYTVTYTNNLNVWYGDGTAVGAGAKIIITGCGNYSGTVEVSFTITPVTLTADIMSEVEDCIYTGRQILPEVSARYLGKPLVANADYTVGYGDNLNVLYVNQMVTEGGNVTLTGKGNFTGTVTKKFKIKPADLGAVTLGEITDKEYTGEAIVPEFTVTLGDVEIERGVGYNLSVSANINVGTATVTLTGNGNFTGSKKTTFNIVACDVTVEIAANGGTVNSVVPATARVFDRQGNELFVEIKLTYTDDSGKTSEDVPNAVGLYTVTAFLVNQNYNVSGDRTAEFFISSAVNNITELTLEDWVFGNPNEPLVIADSGGGASVRFTYYSESDVAMESPLSGKPVDVGGYIVKAEIFPTVAYGYAQAVKSFNILPAELTADMLSVAAQVYTGNQLMPEVIISYLGNEYGTDFYKAVEYGDNVNVSEGGFVTVEAIGNFAGIYTVRFEIMAAEISNEMFSVADMTYTGGQLTPGITFVFGETEPDTDGFTLVYGENINVSEGGTVTVTAGGNFSGEVTVKFNIKPMSVYAVITAYGATAGSVTAATAEAFDVNGNKVDGVEFKFTYTDSAGAVYEVVPQIAGMFTVKAEPVSENYSLAEEACTTFVVSAEKNVAKVELDGWIYGTPNQPCITVNLGDVSKAVITYYEFGDKEMASPLGGQPVNVGIYRVKVVIPATSEYAAAADSTVFEISPKEITVSGIKALDKQFDGNAAAQFDLSGVTFDGLIEGDELAAAAIGSFDGMNAGAHTVTVGEITLIGGASANYTVAEYTEALSANIERRLVKVNITATGGAAGSEIEGATAEVVDFDGDVIDTEVAFTYTDRYGNEVEGVPQTVGTYTITVELTDENYELTGDNTAVFTVSKYPNRVTSFKLESWTYGSPVLPEITAEHGEETVVYTYFSVDGEGKLTEIGAEQPKNAGDYEVVAFIPSTDEYASATAKLQFTVSRKELSLYGITADGKVYDGNTEAQLVFDGVTFDGLVGNDELEVTATGAYDGADAGNRTVTVTGITLSGEAARNYVLTVTEFVIDDVVISPKPVTVKITVANGVVGGESFAVSVTVLNDGVEIETAYSLVYKDGGGNALESIPADAGEYTAEVVLPLGNYVLTGGNTVGFVISANANSVSVELESWTYGEPNLPAINAEFGVDTAVVTYYSVNEEGENTDELEGQPENAGKYLVKVNIKATAEYAGAEASVRFEIAPKEVRAQITVVNGIAGEVEAEVSAKAVDAHGNEVETEVKLIYSDADGNTFEEVPRMSGVYTVKATVADRNYNLTESTATLTVSATANSITEFIQEDWTYGEPAIPVLHAVHGENTAQFTYYSVSDSGLKAELESAPQNTGKYEIVVVISATAEYAGATARARFAVIPKEVTVELAVRGGVAGSNAGSATAKVIGYVGGVAPEVTFTYTDAVGNVYGEMPRAVGAYTAVVTLEDGNYVLTGNNSAEFFVSENANSVTVEIKGWTYGEPDSPVINAEFGEDTAVVTYYRLNAEGGVSGKLEGAPENVGNYLVKVYIAATVGYEDAEAEAEFEITHRSVTVDIDAASDFVGLVKPATAQITDFEGNAVEVDFIITYVAEDGTVYETLPETAGKFTVTVTVPNENYRIIGQNTKALTVTPIGGLKTNGFNLVVSDRTYGEPIEPVIEPKSVNEPIYGAEFVVYTYFAAEDVGKLEPFESVPSEVGEYVVVATIAVNMDEAYDKASESATFSILPKNVAAVITVPDAITVPNSSSALEEGVFARVEIDGLLEIDAELVTVTYVSTDGKGYEDSAPPVEIGSYKVVVAINSPNYELDGLSSTVYFLVGKSAQDENGNGNIDIPDDREFEFAVTEVGTDTNYGLKGLSAVIKARLWEIIDGEISATEFTGSLKATLTFKVPDKISGAISVNGVDIENVKAKLSVYIVTEDGTLEKVENFVVFVKNASGNGKGEFMVKVNYDGKFPLETVFNVESYTAPSKSAMPWWAWLLIAIGIVLVIAALAVTAVTVAHKRRKAKASAAHINRQDGETKRKLAEHEKKIKELLNRDDGGFGTVVNPDDYDV